jgi:hypothetical protein
MTDDIFRPPFDGADQENERTDGLPAHENDPDEAVGSGVMSSGGTAVDRGTGELTGSAQGSDDDDDLAGGVNEGMIPGPPAGGATTYVPGFIDDDDEDGGALPDA